MSKAPKTAVSASMLWGTAVLFVVIVYHLEFDYGNGNVAGLAIDNVVATADEGGFAIAAYG